jgi:predicted nucleic acid-binding protein
METVLVDTDVVSYLLKGDSRAAAYAPLVQGKIIAISFMTVAELYQWAAVRHWGPQRVAHLAQTLANYLVVPTDDQMCRIWGGNTRGPTIYGPYYLSARRLDSGYRSAA